MSSIFDIINIPFGYVIRACYALTHNYALALLIFAIIIKVILFPLGIKQQKNQVKQASMKPREMAIRKRYAGRTDKVTQQKMQEDIMNLYQKENFNPMGGCLPMLVEFPIIIALYNIVTMPLKYICMLSADIITAVSQKCTELGASAITQIQMITFMKENMSEFTSILPEGTVLPNFHLFGNTLDLAATPSFTNISWLIAIPIVTFLVSFFSMKITRKFMYQPTTDSGADPSAAMSMKIMDFTMPLLGVWIAFTVPGVVGLYWIYQNALSAVRQFVLYKMYPLPIFTDDDYRNAEKEMNGKVIKNKESKKKVRSLHHIDDEDDDETDSVAAQDTIEGKKAAISPAKLKDDKNKSNQKQPAAGTENIDSTAGKADTSAAADDDAKKDNKDQ